MAVITELVEAGVKLKRQGNLRGAIEHFRQLHTTYPGNARIMFELAQSWSAFGVPEQALPLYRELLAQPKGQGLPPKDMPRLYTLLGATLRNLGETAEALAIIEEGLRLHPSYRPLRAWRIFNLCSAGSHQAALVDAVELMLESLAPSRWDVFEDEIISVVREMRASLSDEDAPPPVASGSEAKATSEEPPDEADLAASIAVSDSGNEEDPQVEQISVADESGKGAGEIDVAVKVVKPAKKTSKRASRKKKKPAQLGKKSVRIDIGSETGEPNEDADDDKPAAAADGTFKIPVDPD